MPKLKTKEERDRYRKYHIPAGNNFQSVKLNAIFVNRHNDKVHEQMKFDLAWESELYITEEELK
jgi:hypothetical protein